MERKDGKERKKRKKIVPFDRSCNGEFRAKIDLKINWSEKTSRHEYSGIARCGLLVLGTFG